MENLIDPPRYVELHCLSNFSFQRGASSADELFARASELGYAALAITDECSMAGIVRARMAATKHRTRLIVGCEIRFDDGTKLVLLARDHAGYSDMCRLITLGRRRSAKGEYLLARADAGNLGDGVLVLWIPDARSLATKPPHTGGQAEAPDSKRGPRRPSRSRQIGNGTHHAIGNIDEQATWLAQRFPGRAWIAVEHHRETDDATRLEILRTLGERHSLPLVASGDVHMHVRRRRALQDAMTAIRLGCTVAEAGLALFPNGERHLRRVDDLETLYPPPLLAETLRIAALCTFDLGLDYRYPSEVVPHGLTAIEHLRAQTWKGAGDRWPGGIPASVRTQIGKELALIQDLGYEHFFLTVEDIVHWARTRRPPILCQGRGSSANSAVCYCLHITEVTPEEGNLLFERFLSKERKEPPDIDVDFEHERREEVIQYVFGKYGRERAALAATVIRYRGKSAVRDLGRALGVPDDRIDVLAGLFSRIRHGGSFDEVLRERGLDPASRVLRKLFLLSAELRGFPRHLSQHVGGFVISETPLHHLVPVENAAMPERTIIQWDKNDLEDMGLLKVDVLALGMLTALRKCFDLLHAHGLWRCASTGKPRLQDIPREGHESSREVFDMICRADTIGVFQIESRAQMSMLPRLKPRTFYDLVVQIAIVRPGPIQGDMVHPYLRRRNGLEKIGYPQSRIEREAGLGKSAVESVLERTLGVPIFQEQVMKLIQVVAGFTPGEADQLRRAMAAWGRGGDLEPFREKIHHGMIERGYDEAYFQRIFEQIKGFGEYGFPESHSASFANLAWASSWLKHYHPAAFTCALLNAQPMGFYQPSQLVQSLRQHTNVLPADVSTSDWDCTLEPDREPADRSGRDRVALRLGLRQLRGMIEIDRDVDVGDARIARDRDGRADEARSRTDRFRHIGTRVRRAVDALIDVRMHADAEVIGRGRSADGRARGIDECEIGTGVLHREEHRLGRNVRVRRDVAGTRVVDDEDLVAGVAEQREAETTVPGDAITLRIEVERKVDRVARIEVDAVPVLLGRRGRIARAADPAVGRQRIGRRRRVVALHFRRRCAALDAKMQVVSALGGGARGEVVDLEEIGARRRNRRAGDRRGKGGEAAVVVVELDHRGAVRGEQRQLAVGTAAGGSRGHDRCIDAVARVRAERVEIDVAVRPEVPVHGDVGAGDRRSRRAGAVRFHFAAESLPERCRRCVQDRYAGRSRWPSGHDTLLLFGQQECREYGRAGWRSRLRSRSRQRRLRRDAAEENESSRSRHPQRTSERAGHGIVPK